MNEVAAASRGTLHTVLTSLFKASGRTAKEVASEVGITPAALSAALTGKTLMSGDLASDLAIALNGDEDRIMQLWANEMMPSHMPFLLLTYTMQLSGAECEYVKAIREVFDEKERPISSHIVADRLRVSLRQLIEETKS
jgi:transcriptional regulator with XRE-family HTH domain